MVARMILLLQFVNALGALWFLEQPRSSLMGDFHPFAVLGRVAKVSVSVAAYGHENLKPTWLASNSGIINKLVKKVPSGFKAAFKTAVTGPEGGVTGDPEALKKTQQYTP
eukprot:435818-Alexandrium_andersonii.AAC.1